MELANLKKTTFFLTDIFSPGLMDLILITFSVPSDPPSHMEALLLNSSAVYLKWKPPALQAHNGKSEFPAAIFSALCKD